MKIKNIVALSLIPLNTLLLFLLLAEGKINVPAWLQVFGRMHPMFLHFPIVLIVLYLVFVMVAPKRFGQEEWYKVIAELLLLSAALTAVITALMGLFLSREAGYDADALVVHKYTGVFTAFVLFVMYQLRAWLQQHGGVLKGFVCLVTLVVLYTGHRGADITHGEGFISAPITPTHVQPAVAFEDAYVYPDLISPILQVKCMGCHNSNKAKGELVMETKELLLKGGKNGKLWDTTKADLGLLMSRIHLPEEEKEHMPPAGKPQLTDEEATILYTWIKQGADFDKKVTDLLPTDTLRILAAKKLKQSTGENYNFAAADEKEIQKLNNNNRIISAVAIASPALVVNFYNKPFYNSKALEELKTLATQIVELNLENMPVSDADLKSITGFTNLRRLNLNFTNITGASLGELQKLAYLKNISLAGTAVKAAQLDVLTAMPKLKNVFLWSTGVSDKEVAQLQSRNKNISYQTGFKGDTISIKLMPPFLENEETVISKPTALKLKSFVAGAEIRYTLDGKEPDSLTSPVYKNDVTLDANTTLKAKAYKKGWLTSDLLEAAFFKSIYTPDSVILITKPDDQHKVDGGKTLIDHIKSDANSGSGKWLGYHGVPMEAELLFNTPTTVKNVTFSMLQETGSYIFPPVKVQIFTSLDGKTWAPASTVQPPQPQKGNMGSSTIAVSCSFAPTSLRFIKIILQPVTKLPDWHPGKGQKGWSFIDEVFIN